MNKRDNTIRTLFLGQCLNYGYDGVDRASTFPNMARLMLSARFPQLTIKLNFSALHHPKALKRLLRAGLLLRPDIVVISLPAMFAATHYPVNLIYQIAPEIVGLARSFKRRVDAKFKSQAVLKLFNTTSVVHAPMGLDEYERLIEDAVRFCLCTSHCRVVLMGPGRFNEDTNEDYAIHSPKLWSSVNQMVLRIGDRLSVPVINAHDALADYGGEVFLPNNHRWSERGHEVVAREVESILASQIANLRYTPPQ